MALGFYTRLDLGLMGAYMEYTVFANVLTLDTLAYHIRVVSVGYPALDRNLFDGCLELRVDIAGYEGGHALQYTQPAVPLLKSAPSLRLGDQSCLPMLLMDNSFCPR